ncbi:MAG: FixH family protein [Pseudomonadota bacterium]
MASTIPLSLLALGLAALLLLGACAPSPSESEQAMADEHAHHKHTGSDGDAEVRAMLEGASVASAQSTPSSWRALRAEVAAGRMSLDDHGIPESLVPVASKLSDGGHFRISLEAPAGGAKINRLLTYTIAVDDPGGLPVANAQLDFVGGMPLHDHGFPTSPAIGEASAPGRYPLEGLRFGMKGWWQLVLSVQSGDVADTVTFDIAVVP